MDQDADVTPRSENTPGVAGDEDLDALTSQGSSAALAPVVFEPSHGWDDASWTGGAPQGRTWFAELPRWLATLDGTRTRREYEKAVTYFFRTPGVPEHLGDLTFDLLLAYRGSLALRADRQRTVAPGASGLRPTDRLREGARFAHLPPDPAAGTGPTADGYTEPTSAAHTAPGVPTPLAPATVNIRLTALRQFLVHCSLWGQIPHLDPERIRAALRRMRIERRRPYQILAEPEWAAFLEAARGPAQRVSASSRGDQERGQRGEKPSAVASAAHKPAGSAGAAPQAHRAQENGQSPGGSLGARPGGLWGVPRAVRRRSQTEEPLPGPTPSPRWARAPIGDDPALPSGNSSTRKSSADLHRESVETTAHPEVAIPASGVSARPPDDSLVRSRGGLTGERTALRDHALLSLALATGLRAVELCGLDVGDITREWHSGQEEWWLTLPDAKTKGQHGGRTLPLAAALVETLLAYVRATGRRWEVDRDRRTPLFLSKRGQPDRRKGPAQADGSEPGAAATDTRRLSTAQVRRIVDRVETQWRATGGEGTAADRAISPHALRHSTAVALLEGNERAARPPASVEHVRGWLGHFDIRTTQGYLAHLDARRHRRPFTLRPEPDAQRPDTHDPTDGNVHDTVE